MTLTVTVTTGGTSCQICNVAKIQSPVQNNNLAVSSTPACVSATPAADPSTAKANGEAVGLKAYVPLLGIPLVNVDISRAASSQTGLGQSADDEKFLYARHPRRHRAGEHRQGRRADDRHRRRR